MQKNSHLDNLRAEGELVAQGEFGIDRERARQKLRKYQLADPHKYVLEFIEAAHLLGADAVSLHCEPAVLEITFSGVSLSVNDLHRLYDAIFSAGDDARSGGLERLGLGLLHAETLSPAELRVESQCEGQLATLEPLAPEESVRTEPSTDARESLRIELRESFRLRHLARALGHGLGMYPRREASIVQDHCMYAELPISVDGVTVNPDFQPPGTSDTWVEFELPSERGAVAIERSTAGALFELTVNGVVRSQYQFDAPIGARGVIISERLEQDLSRTGFVQNEYWQALTHFLAVAAYHKAASAYIGRRRIGDNPPDWVRELAYHVLLHLHRHGRKELLRVQRTFDFDFLVPATAELANRLRRAKLWQMAYAYAEPNLVSFEQMAYRTRARKGGTIYFSTYTLWSRPEKYKHQPVFLFPHGPPPALQELFDARFVNINS